MRRGRYGLLTGALLVGLVAGSASAGYVTGGDLPLFPGFDWYDGGSETLDVPGGFVPQGWLRSNDGTVYVMDLTDYPTVTEVTLSSCALVQDISSGGVAQGYFAGGATLTISGILYEQGNPANRFEGLILGSQMDISSAETWLVHEDPGAPTNVDGSVGFHSTGGVLHTGAFDGLTMHSFAAHFNFLACDPNPEQFSPVGPSSPGVFSAGEGTHIQITPEPASLLVLLAGVGLAWRKRSL